MRPLPAGARAGPARAAEPLVLTLAGRGRACFSSHLEADGEGAGPEAKRGKSHHDNRHRKEEMQEEADLLGWYGWSRGMAAAQLVT
jgi:hypothetical protein